MGPAAVTKKTPSLGVAGGDLRVLAPGGKTTEQEGRERTEGQGPKTNQKDAGERGEKKKKNFEPKKSRPRRSKRDVVLLETSGRVSQGGEPLAATGTCPEKKGHVPTTHARRFGGGGGDRITSETLFRREKIVEPEEGK